VWKLGGAGNNDWLMRQAILTKDAFYIVDKDVVARKPKLPSLPPFLPPSLPR